MDNCINFPVNSNPILFWTQIYLQPWINWTVGRINNLLYWFQMQFLINFQTTSVVSTPTLWCSRLLFLVFFLLKQLPGLVRSPSSLNCLCSNVSSDNHQWFVTFSFLYSNIKYLVSLCIQSNLIVVKKRYIRKA